MVKFMQQSSADMEETMHLLNKFSMDVNANLDLQTGLKQMSV